MPDNPDEVLPPIGRLRELFRGPLDPDPETVEGQNVLRRRASWAEHFERELADNPDWQKLTEELKALDKKGPEQQGPT